MTNVWFSAMQTALAALLLQTARPSQGYQCTSSILLGSLSAVRKSRITRVLQSQRVQSQTLVSKTEQLAYLAIIATIRFSDSSRVGSPLEEGIVSSAVSGICCNASLPS